MTTLDPAHKATAQKAYDLLEIIYEVGGVDGSRISILQAMTLLAVVILTDDGAKHVTQEDIGGFLRKPQGPISQEIKKWVAKGVLEKDFAGQSELLKTYTLTAKGRGMLTKLRSVLDKKG
jgi:hypothetical protein